MPTDSTAHLPTDPELNAEVRRANFSLRVGGSDPERVIFFLTGHLAGPACSGFEHFTLSCIDGGVRRLRLDFAELQSFDLDGLDTLLAVHEALVAHAGRLFLTNVNAELLSALTLLARPLLATDSSVVFRSAGNWSGKPARSRRRLAG
jgi:anti-anti-sigma regulatory factor